MVFHEIYAFSKISNFFFTWEFLRTLEKCEEAVAFGSFFLALLLCSLKWFAEFHNQTRPKLHDTKFNYRFIISILKLKISFIHIQVFLVFTNILLIQYWASLWKLAKVVFYFPAIWLVPLNKSWYLIGCCVLVKLFHKLALMRANQIARITHDFKLNVKDSELLLYMSF